MAPLRVNKAWEAKKQDPEGAQWEAVCEVTREVFIESAVLGRARSEEQAESWEGGLISIAWVTVSAFKWGCQLN